MRKLIVIGFLGLSCQLLSAQSGPITQSSPADAELNRRLEQQLFDVWSKGGNVDTRQQRIDKIQAQLQAEDFYKKARKFVELWQSFAEELNTKKAVNLKLAQQVSKAFHDMEKSDAWPTKK